MSVNPRLRMTVTLMQLAPTLTAHIIALVIMGLMEMELRVMVGAQIDMCWCNLNAFNIKY